MEAIASIIKHVVLESTWLSLDIFMDAYKLHREYSHLCAHTHQGSDQVIVNGTVMYQFKIWPCNHLPWDPAVLQLP